VPSCVPQPARTAGARLIADDLKLMIADERVAGVAGLMIIRGLPGGGSELAKIRAGKGKNH